MNKNIFELSYIAKVHPIYSSTHAKMILKIMFDNSCDVYKALEIDCAETNNGNCPHSKEILK